MRASDPFVQQDVRVLSPEAFYFVLQNELKRAVRSQNFLTLVVVQPTPLGPSGGTPGDQAEAVHQIARLISRTTSKNCGLIATVDTNTGAVVPAVRSVSSKRSPPSRDGTPVVTAAASMPGIAVSLGSRRSKNRRASAFEYFDAGSRSSMVISWFASTPISIE